MNKRILKAYFVEHIRPVLFYGISILLLFALAGLYEYDQGMKNMSYGLWLLLFFGGLWGVYDFIRYRKKCGRLMDTVSRTVEREGHMPAAETLPEAVYQEMIAQEEQEKRSLVTEYDAARQDAADYYTMWIHQIKTPIAAMRLLLEDKEETPQTSAQKQAREELFKIEEYAEMALHYARLDSLSSDLSFKKQEIYGIIRRAVKKYGILFIGSGLTFSMEPFSCCAVTDEKWISFVIEQILSNAIKYTKTGGIRVYGADEKGEECRGEVAYVVIQDTGMGIREEDLPRIFERGFTGRNGRVDQKATGIGLYLCRQIMDRLSHRIWVESREREGTKVILGFDQENVTEM